jgi:F-type H+-transporting ATPase subunit a
MNLTPDQTVFWQWQALRINATLVFTWAIMALLVMVSWQVTRRLSASTRISRWQNILEVLVLGIKQQIEEISQQTPEPYLPFVGTLFIFVAVANFLSIIPGYEAPTSSLSTTTALAICVFFAVPIYGMKKRGFWGYLKEYMKPIPLMLPFNIIGEFSRVISLAVRLFGNMMSGTMIIAILLSIAPLFLPVVMQVMEMLTGLIQAYIFSILAMVYIAAATQMEEDKLKQEQTGDKENG